MPRIRQRWLLTMRSLILPTLPIPTQRLPEMPTLWAADGTSAGTGAPSRRMDRHVRLVTEHNSVRMTHSRTLSTMKRGTPSQAMGLASAAPPASSTSMPAMTGATSALGRMVLRAGLAITVPTAAMPRRGSHLWPSLRMSSSGETPASSPRVLPSQRTQRLSPLIKWQYRWGRWQHVRCRLIEELKQRRALPTTV